MSEDEKIVDAPSEESVLETIMEDEDSVQAVIKRKKNGTFRKGHSGNRLGRPKNTKNRHSKDKLDTMIERGGVAGIKMAMQIMQDAYREGDKNLALRASIQFMDKYYHLTLHNEKLELQKMEAKKKEKASEEDDDEQYSDNTVVQFTFGASGT